MQSRVRGVLDRLVGIAHRPGDTEQERAHKATHLLIALVSAIAGVIWAGIYAAAGLWVTAAIPFSYSLVTAAALGILAGGGRLPGLRTAHLAMWLVVPFLIQWSLGGFVTGSAAGVWALSSPLLATAVGARPRPWLVGFVALSVLSAVIEGPLSDRAPQVPRGAVEAMFALNFIGVGLVAFVALAYFIRERDRAHRELEEERHRSELLLLNILPAEVAERLKGGETVIADRFEQVTVLFADLVGSTPMSERLTPEQLVEVLNDVFVPFDDLADRLGLEKIKTVGDAYMVVGGLPVPRPDHAAAVAEMALAMRDELTRHVVPGHGPLQMRFGIDTGTVVAGIIGTRKFSYDLWGDTVNTAARMESHGLSGEIQVTDAVRRALEDRYLLAPRGPVEIKGKGTMETWLLRGRRGDAAAPGGR